MAEWSLYLVRTCRGALYTGIATDVARRLGEHAGGGPRGSRYLRAQAPLLLVYQVRLGNRALASRAEHRVKRLPKRTKERLVADAPAAARLLELLGLTPAS
ncbi:MAG TPA: GIY-YIG nuclease family protein [Gammaproteobacteria bacterium]